MSHRLRKKTPAVTPIVAWGPWAEIEIVTFIILKKIETQFFCYSYFISLVKILEILISDFMYA